MVGDILESLHPGWLTTARTRTEKFRGKRSPSRISYYRSQMDGIHCIIVGTAALFENIEGAEEEWAEEALPTYFPTVSNARQHVNGSCILCRIGKGKL